MRSFLKMSDQRRHIMLIGSVDFVCTTAFGISTPFVYQEVLGILWCMIMFSADLCLIYGAIYMSYKCVVVWLAIMAVNIIFLIMLLPIIPMMIIAICLGNNAIEDCYKRKTEIKHAELVWLFRNHEGVNLTCNEANEFFKGLKGIMCAFMVIIAILPLYYILAWTLVNQFRNKCANI